MCLLEEADSIGDRRSRPAGQSEGEEGIGKCSLKYLSSSMKTVLVRLNFLNTGVDSSHY